MNPQLKSNLIWLGVVLVCGLILYADYVSSQEAIMDKPLGYSTMQSEPILNVITTEIKEGNICIKEKNNKGNIEITDITEPLTMVEISQILKQNTKNNIKQCYKITKEYTKENNKIIKSELKTISKK